jgi:hypothetical protein
MRAVTAAAVSAANAASCGGEGAEPAAATITSSLMRGVCKYFVNTGSCSAGSSCRFSHPHAAAYLAMKAQWVEEKVTRRCMRPTVPADSADPHGKVRVLLQQRH